MAPRLAPFALIVLLAPRPLLPAPPDPQATLDAAREAESSEDDAKAAALYEQAVREVSQLGETHELYSSILFAAASFHELAERPLEAERLYRILVAALERTGSMEVVSAYELLADLLCARKATDEAKELYAKSVARQAKEAGSEESAEIANSYRDLGRCLAAGDRPKEAAAAFARQLQIRESLHGVGAPSTVPALMESAQSLAASGDAARARSLLERALEGIDEAQGSQAELLRPFRKSIEDELAKLP